MWTDHRLYYAYWHEHQRTEAVRGGAAGRPQETRGAAASAGSHRGHHSTRPLRARRTHRGRSPSETLLVRRKVNEVVFYTILTFYVPDTFKN